MLTISLLSLLIAVPLFSYRITPTIFNRITVITLFFSAYLSFFPLQKDVEIYNGLFHVTNISLAIEILLFIIGAFVLVGWANSKVSLSGSADNTQTPTIPEHSLLIVFTTVGGSLLISSSDLVSIFLSIELQSFAVYVLATLYRDSESATAAGLKYFLLGGLSSAVILLGTAIIYNNTGLTHFESIYNLASVSDSRVSYIELGITFIGIGFLFKVASAPFHNWAPDVYDGTPTIVTTWLTTIPKISIFTLLLEFSTLAYFTDTWRTLILVASLLSLLFGTILGLSQYRIKRLLTYSTISHVGFLLLALSINTQESTESFIFYLMQYSITNLNVFLVLLAFGYILYSTSSQDHHVDKHGSSFSVIDRKSDIAYISQLKGQFVENPFLSVSFALSLFSMAGIPPLIGFFAKQIVLYSSMHTGYYFMSVIAVLVSVVSASYYLKIIQVIYFDTDTNKSSYENHSIVSNIHSTSIAIMTAIILLFIFQPIILLNSCHLLALSIFSY